MEPRKCWVVEVPPNALFPPAPYVRSAASTASSKREIVTTSSHPCSAAGEKSPPGGRNGRLSDSCHEGALPFASRVRNVWPWKDTSTKELSSPVETNEEPPKPPSP